MIKTGLDRTGDYRLFFFGFRGSNSVAECQLPNHACGVTGLNACHAFKRDRGLIFLWAGLFTFSTRLLWIDIILEWRRKSGSVSNM